MNGWAILPKTVFDQIKQSCPVCNKQTDNLMPDSERIVSKCLCGWGEILIIKSTEIPIEGEYHEYDGKKTWDAVAKWHEENPRDFISIGQPSDFFDISIGRPDSTNL